MDIAVDREPVLDPLPVVAHRHVIPQVLQDRTRRRVGAGDEEPKFTVVGQQATPVDRLGPQAEVGHDGAIGRRSAAEQNVEGGVLLARQHKLEAFVVDLRFGNEDVVQ